MWCYPIQFCLSLSRQSLLRWICHSKLYCPSPPTAPFDPHPWWAVDLEAEYCLGRVNVTLRRNCCCKSTGLAFNNRGRRGRCCSHRQRLCFFFFLLLKNVLRYSLVHSTPRISLNSTPGVMLLRKWAIVCHIADHWQPKAGSRFT